MTIIGNIKRSRIPGSDITRSEEFTGEPVNLKRMILMPWGQPVEYRRLTRQGKLSPKSYTGIFVGPSLSINGGIEVYSYITRDFIDTDTYSILKHVPNAWINIPKRFFTDKDAPAYGEDIIDLDRPGMKTRARTSIEKQIVEARNNQLNAELNLLVNDEANTEANAEANTEANAGVNATPNAGVNATPNVGVNATPNADVNATPNAGVNATPNADVNATVNAIENINNDISNSEGEIDINALESSWDHAVQSSNPTIITSINMLKSIKQSKLIGQVTIKESLININDIQHCYVEWGISPYPHKPVLVRIGLFPTE
jgi:hypothetical protein